MRYILMVLLFSGCAFIISGCAMFDESPFLSSISQSESEDCTVRPLTEICASLETEVSLIGEV